MNNTGKKVLTARKAKGFSQEKLAEEANINLRTLQRIEKGSSRPHGDTLNRIALALEIPMEDLNGTEKKKWHNYLYPAGFVVVGILLGWGFTTIESFEKEPENTLITKSIQYYVNIGDKEAADFTWWRDHIPVAERYPFLTNLYEKALAGEVKCCDVHYNPVDTGRLKELLTERVNTTMEDMYSGHDAFDTVISYQLAPQQIDMLQFMEEWTYNEEDLLIEKRVLAVGLAKKVYFKDGGTANRPLFWIYFDDAFLETDKGFE